MWIQTFTKKKVNPLSIQPEDIIIEDIAHSLALTCRFKGHCRIYYSVAEHCVRMSLIENFEGSRAWLLLHDAAETYMPDIPTPLKSIFKSAYMVEKNIQSVIAKRFNLNIKDYNYNIMLMDMRMMATEARDLMDIDPQRDWGMRAIPFKEKIIPWKWGIAEKKFLERAKELNIK
jgi:hypothetical protein